MTTTKLTFAQILELAKTDPHEAVRLLSNEKLDNNHFQELKKLLYQSFKEDKVTEWKSECYFAAQILRGNVLEAGLDVLDHAAIEEANAFGSELLFV